MLPSRRRRVAAGRRRCCLSPAGPGRGRAEGAERRGGQAASLFPGGRGAVAGRRRRGLLSGGLGRVPRHLHGFWNGVSLWAGLAGAPLGPVSAQRDLLTRGQVPGGVPTPRTGGRAGAVRRRLGAPRREGGGGCSSGRSLARNFRK